MPSRPTPPTRHRVALAALATLLLLAGCSGSGTGPSSGPTSVQVAAGNFQFAPYGTALATPPSVLVRDALGPLVDYPVAFTVSSGGGSVTGGNVRTNAQGIATVGSWTLGPAPGTNTLTATAGTKSAVFTATALAGPPTALVIQGGDNQSGVQGSATPVAPSVKAVDANNFGVAGVTVNWAATAGGGTALPASTLTGSNGVATLTTWVLGAGQNTLTASATGVASVNFSATGVPLVVTTLSKTAGDNLSGFAGNFSAVPPTVTVLNQFGQAASGVPITFQVTSGSGTLVTATATSDLTGVAKPQAWRYGPAGSQAVSATPPAGSVAAPVSFQGTATSVPASQFSIELRLNSGTTLTPAVQAAFDAAVARWSQVVVGALTPVTVSAGGLASQSFTFPGQSSPSLCTPAISGGDNITNVRIYVSVGPLDGVGKVLGAATPVWLRSTGNLPFVGCMIFDSADLTNLAANGTLNAVILHEMGHVLGIGTIWSDQGLLRDTVTNDPWFKGNSAGQAFFAASASPATFAGNVVPVENCVGLGSTCGPGTIYSHWRELTFGDELMTGYINALNPLSAITAASLRDLGYVVNDAVSDAYSLPIPPAFGPSAAFVRASGTALGEFRPAGPLGGRVDASGRVTEPIVR